MKLLSVSLLNLAFSLLIISRTVDAWLLLSPGRMSSRVERMRPPLSSSVGPLEEFRGETNQNGGDDDEEECADEEECEIDWSKMPNTENSKSSLPRISQMKLRLEMQWKMHETDDECDVQLPQTCGSDPCEDCQGRGWNDCRFCHGTTVLRMNHSFSTCPVCRQGIEVCRHCQGSGWIGAFTRLKEETTN